MRGEQEHLNLEAVDPARASEPKMMRRKGSEATPFMLPPPPFRLATPLRKTRVEYDAAPAPAPAELYIDE